MGFYTDWRPCSNFVPHILKEKKQRRKGAALLERTSNDLI